MLNVSYEALAIKHRPSHLSLNLEGPTTISELVRLTLDNTSLLGIRYCLLPCEHVVSSDINYKYIQEQELVSGAVLGLTMGNTDGQP
jgi:sulfite exporter TauE/SafE